jgi:hypothetical protein
LHAFLISANLCRGGRRGVWFRVLCDVQRRHNRDRDGDSLWDKGNHGKFYLKIDLVIDNVVERERMFRADSMEEIVCKHRR